MVKKRKVLLLLLSLMTITNGFAQQLKVSGKIIDEAGQALVGVNVIEKGTTNGVISNYDGNYEISVEMGKTLQFSFIGMKKKSVIVTEEVINITMIDMALNLDEVVAVGYGTMRKSDVVGSTSRVSAKMFADQNNVSLDQTLTGRVAGVQVVSNSGAPGSGVSIRMRGGTSINASNEPLYVIDGMPFVNDQANASTAGIGFDNENPMVNIDPSDIANIEILKDASATAIYGSRGANGVILVTTKSGKAGKTKLTYKTTMGVSEVARRLDLLDGTQYAEFIHAVDPGDDRFTNIETGEAISYADSTQVDWQDEIFRLAKLQTHNLSLSGGDKKTTYSINGSYIENEGVIMNTELQRYSTRMKVNHQYNEFFTLSANYSASLTEENGVISAGTQSGANAGLVTNLINFRPTAIYNANGDMEEIDEAGGKTNPFVFVNGMKKISTTIRNIGNVDLTFNLHKNLVFKSTGGFNFNNIKKKQYYPSNVGAGRNTTGKGIQSDVLRKVWLNDNVLTYSNKFDNHSVTAMLGTSVQTSITEKLDVTNTVFDIENNAVYDIDAGTAPLIPNSDIDEWALVSYFGRLSYNFKDKYLVNATFRADGSSRFGSNNRFGYFPSVGVAWRVNQEDFLKDSKYISNLKVRAGWGQTGNQGIGSFNYLELLAQENYSFNNGIVTGMQPSNIGNPDLKWETTIQTNIGLDLGFFSNRINVVIDAYDKQTKDLLLNMPVSQVSGYSNVMANIGELSNRGLEIAINTVNVDTKNFKWYTDFNIAFNKNKINKLVNEGQDIFIDAEYNSTVPVTYVLREGESIGSMFGYVWDKNDPLYQIEDFTWQENSNPDIAHEDRVYTIKDDVAIMPGTDVYPGHIKYQNTSREDVNGDGVITDDEQQIDTGDRQIVGNGLPIHFGGLSNTFKYKSIDCSIGLQWSYGNDIYNANKFEYLMPNLNKNQHVDILNYWTPENTNTTIPSVEGKATFLPSTYVVEDGSYLRLNNITIGYTLPKKFVKKVKLSKVRIYVTGTNLYTWTDYSGFSPDVSVTGGVGKGLLTGLDYSSYPQVRTFLGGVTIDF